MLSTQNPCLLFLKIYFTLQLTYSSRLVSGVQRRGPSLIRGMSLMSGCPVQTTSHASSVEPGHVASSRPQRMRHTEERYFQEKESLTAVSVPTPCALLPWPCWEQGDLRADKSTTSNLYSSSVMRQKGAWVGAAALILATEIKFLF